MFYQGKFSPRNPQKYKGNPANIVYRSSWELRVMNILDTHPQVIWWASEELPIRYRSPIDGRERRYFPDFIVQMRRKDGASAIYMLEIKPESQTSARTLRRTSRKLREEAAQLAVNQAKWTAADEFCQDQGWTFKVITERHLNLL